MHWLLLWTLVGRVLAKCTYSAWQKKMVGCDDIDVEKSASSKPRKSSRNQLLKPQTKSHGSSKLNDEWWPDPIKLVGNRASYIHNVTHSNDGRKIAFLFLTRGALPLEPIWRLFFASPELAPLFNIYVHPSPNFDCGADVAYRPPSPFAGRCLPRFFFFFIDSPPLSPFERGHLKGDGV